MTQTLRRGMALAVTLTIAACASGGADPAGIDRITSTTSFGMCVGYCKTTLDIAEGEAVLTREPWGRGAGGDLEPQRISARLSESEWREFVKLAAATDLAGLPDVIGCPDCADGGAESLTIVADGVSKTIAFDHGAAIKEADPLLRQVRALRQRLTPKEE